MATPAITRSAAIAALLVGVLVAGWAGTAATSSASAPVHREGSCSRGDVSTPPTVAYDALPRTGTFGERVADADGRAVLLGSRVLGFSDFTPGDGTIDGADVGGGAAGLIGAGVARTFFEVAPRSSTQAAAIPQAFPQTNQLSVLRVDGSVAVLRGFTVRGTPQGHLYNGLRVSRVHALRADGLRVVGIAGSAAAPPGETFGINDYRTDGSRWSHVVVDGAGVGASGFGVNGSADITLCDVVSKHNRYAMGFAFWQTHDIRIVDAKALDNGYSGFNFERVSGTVTVIRPVARGNRYGFRIASDRGSARFVIVDPARTNGTFTVTLPKRWYGTSNLQRRSDITLIVHGRQRPDLLRFVTP